MLKKHSLVLLSVALTSTVFAGFTGTSNTLNLSSVKSLEGLKDSSIVKAEGHIVSHKKEDYYIFKDATGEIIIEIPDRVFNDMTITPEDKIHITGELEKTWMKTYVWVKHIRKIDTASAKKEK